jgi:DNA polymerase-3 subunit gamma/tau
VSFTNGELTYSNTLEHLNILDADYYFRILDAMERQNLSDALLTYDSINRKGFEGDLVLNGLAEFVRNLLVCKDEKVAFLLEVVESFRDRYIVAGRQADTSYLISALNVLNEAEINYKSARNKRLHVELALIKLCYLAQALQVSSGEGGGKKRADAVRPVAFRNIPAMELVRRQSYPADVEGGSKGRSVSEPGAKLIIETGAAQQRVETAQQRVETAQPDTPSQRDAGTAQDTPGYSTTPSGAGGLGSLSRIRQQFASKQQNDAVANIRPLEPEALHRSWQQYADYLRENRNPAVQSLELAQLRITDTQTFEVVTGNNLEQKFIEQEKRNLSDHLQKAFSNKALSFTVIVEEKEGEVGEPVDRPLNKREQFQQIVEQYPLVKELKDRLRLELDY